MGFNIEGYADDHQVYLNFSPTFQNSVLTESIPNCFTAISSWMNAHFLYLNANKTEIMLTGPEKLLSQIGIHGTFLSDGTCLRFTKTAKNLGVYFDRHLKFDTQINSVVSSCFYSLRNISRMKKF